MGRKGPSKSEIFVAAIPHIKKLLEQDSDWRLSEKDFSRLRNDDGTLKWGGLTQNRINAILNQMDVQLETLRKLAKGLGVGEGNVLGVGDWAMDLNGWPARLERLAGIISPHTKINEKTGLGKAFLYNLKERQGNCKLSSVGIVCTSFNVTLEDLLASKK